MSLYIPRTTKMKNVHDVKHLDLQKSNSHSVCVSWGGCYTTKMKNAQLDVKHLDSKHQKLPCLCVQHTPTHPGERVIMYFVPKLQVFTRH